MPPAAITEERRQRLLEMIRRQGFASLGELSQEMKVSQSTVRRDLEHLEDQGSAKRTHGGVFYTGGTPKLQHFDDRQANQWEQKKAIAHKAAELLDDGDTVLLDGGSTTYEVAQLLINRSIQVVTNSLPVANLFLSSPNNDLILIGGYVHSRTGVTMGHYADEMIRQLTVRRTILSVAGINDQGYYNSNMLLVETERAMMQAADEVIIVVDSTKFGHQSLVKLASLDAAKHVVVDNQISEDWRSKLCAAGVNVHIAGPTDNG